MRRPRPLLPLALPMGLLLVWAVSGRAAVADSTGYARSLAAARGLVVEVGAVRMDAVKIGEPAAGENAFAARLTNSGDAKIRLAIDLRAEPGYWLMNFQGQTLVELGPGESKVVEATYRFPSITRRSRLRLTLAVPELDPDGKLVGFGEVLFRRWFEVGDGNPASTEAFAGFERYDSDHFELYVHGGYLPKAEVEAVLAEREDAYDRIVELLAVELDERVSVFFFPDSATKTTATGHVGVGLARAGTLVEIHNDEVRLDPYHELTHIVAAELGHPPALFVEGLAVHVAERFGADALRYLGHPGARVDDVVERLRAEGDLLPLEELFALTDIGPEESRPTVSYAQAAAVVGHLVETYGWGPFRLAYATLESTSDPEGVARNAEALEVVFGVSLEGVERELAATR